MIEKNEGCIRDRSLKIKRQDDHFVANMGALELA